MPTDKALPDLSDAEFRDEAREWAKLAHSGAAFGASYRVGRLLSMLERSERDLRRADTRTRQLEDMTEELFKTYMDEQTKLRKLQADCDEWKRQADDVAVFVNDEDVVPLEAGDLEEAEASLARELGVARAGILDALATFRRIAPDSMRSMLERDVRRVLA